MFSKNPLHNQSLSVTITLNFPGREHISVLSLIFILTIFSPFNFVGLARAYDKNMSDCVQIKDAIERLQCYDELGEHGEKKEDVSELQEGDTVAPETESSSYLSKLWELDKESRRGKYALTPYRSNYILPFSYVKSPNEETFQEASPDKELKNAEIKLQLSFKIKLWQDIFRQNMDLWFGYTQLSLWQFYNFEDSSPFRETNYEPELLLNFRTNYNLVGLRGLRGRYINVGINHQSNGRSEPLSRSWNRIVANFGIERDNLVLILNTWLRIPEDDEDDDNPDIDEYLGYGQIWLYYLWHDHRFGVMFRNNLRWNDNRSTYQIEWSIPLVKHVSGYIQYFNGYGESLVDYNARINRIGVGFIVKDW